MRGLRGLPLVLVLVVQDVLPRAEAQYPCSSNADCQYTGCNDISCAAYESHPRCNNGVWDAACVSISCPSPRPRHCVCVCARACHAP